MPATGAKLHNWQMNQRSRGGKGLDSKIEKENEADEGGTVWIFRKVRLENCITSKNVSKKSAGTYRKITGQFTLISLTRRIVAVRVTP